MKKVCINYPLAERHSAALDYINGIDWDQICGSIYKNAVTYFDISKAIDIFPHLELDNNYSVLLCGIRISRFVGAGCRNPKLL